MQRSSNIEYLMCFFPTSAATLAIRLMCSIEALHGQFTLGSEAPVSLVTTLQYCIILFFDVLVYSGIAILLATKAINEPDNSIRDFERISVADASNRLSATFSNSEYCKISQEDEEAISAEESFVSLDVVNLSKEFESEAGARRVLYNINAKLFTGKITALLGSNGAG